MSDSQNRTLPRGWCQVEIDEVAEIVTGNTPPKNDPKNYGSSYPWVRPPDLGSYAAILDTTQQLSERGASFARLLPPGAVLVSCIGTLGRVGIAGTTLATNQQINSLVFRKGVEPRYGFYFCQTLAEWLTANSSATTIAIINKSRFSKAPFLLAPTKEQTRIVAEIEKQFTRLDAAVAALKRVQANLKRYRAAVLKAACEGRLVPTEAELARKEGRTYETGEQLLARILKERRAKWEAGQLAKMVAAGKPPKDDEWKKKYRDAEPPDAAVLPALPNGWIWASLDAIAEIKGGITKGQQRRPTDVLRSVPYLRVANVQRGYLDLAQIKEIEATEAEIAELRLQPGDVLFNEGGDRDKLGRGWVWDGQLSLCIHQNHVFRARLHSSAVQPKFLSWYANSFGQRYFFDEGKQTTNLASVNMTKLKALPIPIPPAAEQLRIVQEVERQLSELDDALAAMHVSQARADRLRQSILKRAFEGKLVPQDSNDEPASVLLERIGAERAACKPRKKLGRLKLTTAVASS